MRLEKAVESFMSGYFSTCRRSDKTRAAYRVDLAQFQVRFGKHTLVSEITSDLLENWATELQKRRYASVSIRRKFASVRVFFSYWIRKGLMDTSPFIKLHLDLVRQRLLPRALSPSDAKRLIEQCWCRVDSMTPVLLSPRGPQFRAIRDLAALEILFATGIRVGELVRLDCNDWREDDSSFVVIGKGSRQRLAILPDERSRKALQIYFHQRNAMNFDHDALLVNSLGKRISTQGISKMLRITAARAEIKCHITPHMIRHTVATLLLRCGADIRIVQEVLGHSSIATTQRYTHIAKDHLISTLRTKHPNHYLKIEASLVAGTSQLRLPFA